MKTLLRGLMALAFAACLAAPVMAQNNPTPTCAGKDTAGNCYPGFSTVLRSVATDYGASVGTSSVILVQANPWRRGFSIQNQSASADCYISGINGATADYHSLKIAAGTYYETPPTHVGVSAISIICTGAATPVYAREW